MPTFRQIESRLQPSGLVQAGPAARPLDLSPVAQPLAQLADEMQRRDDDQALFAARTALNDWESRVVTDPEKGAITLKGRDAFAMPKAVAEDFDKTTEQLAAGMNDRARMAFMKLAQARREQVMGWADRHVVREREVYATTQFNVNIASSKDRAATLAAIPVTDEVSAQFKAASVAAEIQIGQKIISDFLRRPGAGASEEVIGAASKEFASDAHLGVIRALTKSGDLTAADTYLQRNSAAMLEKDRENALNVLKPVQTAAKGEAIGKEVTAQFDFRETGKAMRAVDDMQAPPEIKAAARQFIANRHSVERQDWTDNQGEAMGRIHQALYSGVSRASMLASPDFQRLGDKERGQALEMFDKKQYSDTLRAQATDSRAIAALQRHETELRLKGAASAYEYMDPARLANTSRGEILTLLPTLGQHWVETLLSRKDSMGKRDAQDVKVDHDDMLAALREAGMKGKSEQDKAMMTTTISRIERALTAKQAGQTAPMSREQKNEIIRAEAARTASVDGFWGSTEMPIMEMTPEQLSKVIVPPQEWDSIRAEMADLYKRSAGKLTQFEPTQENMRRYYLTYRKGSITAPMIPAGKPK